MGHTIYFTTLQKKGGEKEKRSPVHPKKKDTNKQKVQAKRRQHSLLMLGKRFVKCCENEENKVKKISQKRQNWKYMEVTV